jgi:hypothetical protein
LAELLEKGVGRRTTALAVVTTTEIVCATSEPLAPPRAGVRAILRGLVELDSGTATDGVTVRIRRGTTITGTLVSEAIEEETTAALAETWVVSAVDTLGDVATVQYVVTVQQATASANGTVDNATIEVDLIG